MFAQLGKLVTRHWILVVLAWAALAVGLKIAAPRWDDVTFDGDLEHLPKAMASIQGARLMDRAFPGDRSKSQVVLVVARQDEKLRRDDKLFARRLAEEMARLDVGEGQQIVDVLTPSTEVVGDMLKSRDKQAELVVLQMSSEFMATSNIELLSAVGKKRDEVVTAYAKELGPEGPVWRRGLQVGITGSAAIGGDMLSAAAESIANTEIATIVLVVVILLFVYRAPLLVLVPLVSIGVSVAVATSLVAALTQLGPAMGWEWWDFKVFKTTKIFVVVILFGAGTDYCLFLISRYKEELNGGLSRTAATAAALTHVGDALAASALTTIVGLSMMFFADFGKYTSSGPAIALCLTVTLAACITLAPAMLRAFGPIVFWPFKMNSTMVGGPTSSDNDLSDRSGFIGGFWQRLADAVLVRPGLILTVALMAMLPLAYIGKSVQVTYDLLGELDSSRESVRGTALLQRHFPPGDTGPVTVVAYQPGAHFKSKEGNADIQQLVSDIFDVPGIVSVRSLMTVTGDKPGTKGYFSGALKDRVAAANPEAKEKFVSTAPRYADQVTRLRVILNSNPFSAEAIDQLDALIAKLNSLSADPQSAWNGAEFLCVGTTAGIRDLRAVTESDRTLIQRLVLLAVLMVLLLILKRPLICCYLILSVLFSYFVTIGLSQLVFQGLYGETFHGLDWKVPLFLFVILIAVGEDYNIYLATRVFEEQAQLGLREGLRQAVVKTGGIITSCGVIMAGTFCSMMTGSLRGMTELGFALSLGVLLDTFVVRTILVPAFFALIIPREGATLEAATSPEQSAAAAQSAAGRSSAAAQSTAASSGSRLDDLPGSVERSVR